MKHYLPTRRLIFLKSQLLLAVLLAIAFIPQVYAQGYIRDSRVIGGSGNQVVIDLIVDAGYSYVLGTTTGNNYPITLGGVPTGTTTKSTLTKLDPSGNIVWSRYLPFGSSGAVTYAKMVLANGTLYFAGSTTSANVPVTNGSVAGGGTGDILFTKIDALSGTILHNRYLGGNALDDLAIDLVVENGYAYITYLTSSSNIPVTTGPAFTSSYDHVVQKLDASGNIVYSTYTGQAATGSLIPLGNISLKVENSVAYLAFPVGPTNNFVTTDGSTHSGSYDIGIVRLDANGNKTLAKLIGGSSHDNSPMLAINNGDIYLAAATNSSNYPTTDGSSKGTLTGIVLSKISSNGNLVFSGYLAGALTGANIHQFKPVIQYKDGFLYLAVSSLVSTGFTVAVTDGSTGGSALFKINPANGAVQYATRFGEIRTANPGASFLDVFIDNDAIYTTSPVEPTVSGAGGAFVTDGSSRTSQSGTFIAKHSLNGQLLYASFLTARASVPGFGGRFSVAAENGKIYVSGGTIDANSFPVTKPALGPTPVIAETDPAWAVLEFCPPVPTDNTISPLSQSTCQGGLVQGLTGNEVIFSSSQVPLVYINGTATEQLEIRPRYQWQSSTSASGPWAIIQNGIQKDYIPPTAAQTLYYRRLVLPPVSCGDIPVSISPVAEVVITGNASPIITSSIFNTCINTPVNISAIASGGTAPYSYAWDNGISSTTNSATVTPTANSVYTMTVTDANGCQQIGQAIVNAYAVDAGPSTATVCAGSPVRIGSAPPAGLAGVTYSWTPGTGLDDATAAQPLATPGSTTVYTVEMTIPVSGGGTCATTDNITVNVQAAPATINFAGTDQAACKGGTLSLGTTAEAGFTYTWAPGSYLSSVTTSTTNFSAGTTLPQPNPFIYTLTATSNGCSFSDQVSVAVLDVNAGDDYCGPRTVGTADKTPGVTGKTYLWEVVSGPGTITGATNTPTTTVSASSGGNTTYRVTVSHLGATCSDEVVVTEGCSGGCPTIQIDTLANQKCPSSVFGQVSLRARPDLSASEWTYTCRHCLPEDYRRQQAVLLP